jgi:AraC-like DNA-binding protein
VDPGAGAGLKVGNPEALLRSVAFVERMLKEEASVRDMADAACWSVYHFCRVFTEAFGMGPYDYLMRRRVSEAALEILGSDRRITDIAFDFRFGSPEAFSRSCRRALGVLPSRLREEGKAVFPRLLPALSRDLVEASADRETRPRVSRIGLPPLALRGQAAIMDRSGAVSSVDPQPCLERLLAATRPGFASRDGERFAVLGSAGVASVALFLGEEAPESDPSDPSVVWKRTPALTCAGFAVPSGTPHLRVLRSFCHALWIPASGIRLWRDVEVFRFTTAKDRVLDFQLLIPLETPSSIAGLGGP